MPSPSSRKTHRSLIGIAENIELAKRFVADCDVTTFVTDTRTIYAATRCLEIISEAARRLPTALTARYPDVPWKKQGRRKCPPARIEQRLAAHVVEHGRRCAG